MQQKKDKSLLEDKVKDKLKSYIRGLIEKRLGPNSNGAKFVMELVESNIDLMLMALKKRNILSKEEVYAYFAKRAYNGAKALNTNQYAECMFALIDFVKTARGVLIPSPIGWTIYLGYGLIAGMEAGFACHLAYQNYQIQKMLDEIGHSKIDRNRPYLQAAAENMSYEDQLVLLDRELTKMIQYDRRAMMCVPQTMMLP